MSFSSYPVGTQGVPWGNAEKQHWFSLQQKKRCYFSLVVSKINALNNQFDVEQYGELPYATRYPLFILKNKTWQTSKPIVLVTGGVHGYESSGVFGALEFASTLNTAFLAHFNFIIAPCISPWGFETINRWNPDAIDPNRSFYADSPALESHLLQHYLAEFQEDILIHIDLHETTDSDNSEFRPALAARDNTVHSNWNIPDGFYLVADEKRPQLAFQHAIIKAVEKVTHIAPADQQGKLIGVDLSLEGVITYEAKKLGLCMGLTNAPYVTTTEVYPDSPLVDDANCTHAQVAAINSAIEFVLNLNSG